MSDSVNTSRSNQKFVINALKEAIAHWPTPHVPFINVSSVDPELGNQFRFHWEPHEKHIAENIAIKLSARLGTTYVVRNVELGKEDVRRYSY